MQPAIACSHFSLKMFPLNMEPIMSFNQAIWFLISMMFYLKFRMEFFGSENIQNIKKKQR